MTNYKMYQNLTINIKKEAMPFVFEYMTSVGENCKTN